MYLRWNSHFSILLNINVSHAEKVFLNVCKRKHYNCSGKRRPPLICFLKRSGVGSVILIGQSYISDLLLACSL